MQKALAVLLSFCYLFRCDEDGEGDGLKPADLQQLQEARVDKLAVYLTALLRRYVEGDAEGFKVGQGGRKERRVKLR